ncbi:Condensin-2 complex subunit G2 [Auxenochlorella protothecoides]|uniref:Condensin-2 complex subunit G2 n=1 Tax=Auxenochlorella protothecoides TaxID=3075 RepID=A0A087SFS9_AUXPR|nr:Condensin-2 complex subunit G2 [Auxenochlorella protothecoides]KFM24583.1 Condensin-2 complex subunit G2 [Auxenochlorella protothecoides]
MSAGVHARLGSLLRDLQGAEVQSESTFLQLADASLGPKSIRQEVQECLQVAQRKEMAALCDALYKKARSTEAACAAVLEIQTAEVTASEAEPGSPGLPPSALSVLGASAVLARLMLGETKASPPPGLHATAALLHDNCLLYLCDSPVIQEAVARLCLEWWQAGAPGRNALVPSTIAYLVAEAVGAGTTAAVKRCHAIRHGLDLLDYEDEESIVHLKRLLLKATFCPAFLRCSEGRRFLAHLFRLQPAFVAELTAIIKNQVPAGRASGKSEGGWAVLDAYGEILFRAVSGAEGEQLGAVVAHCLQPLAEAALLASSPGLGANLRRVLRGLHSRKHEPGVDDALLEAYGPLLLRRLAAPNPRVRVAALRLLADAFPLRDPAEDGAAADERLGDQFRRLRDALGDDAPAVRAAAARATAQVLGAYWELVPAALTASLLSRVCDLGLDTASIEARCAAAEALAGLAELPLAAPLLKKLLPRLRPQLFDASPRVRAGFADLLLSLGGLSGLSWLDVVAPQDLIGVLGCDTPALSQRVHQLLLPSFLPDEESAPGLLVSLLRSQPEAGRRLCLHLAGGVESKAQDGTVLALPSGPAVGAGTLASLLAVLTEHLLSVQIVGETGPDSAPRAKPAVKPRRKAGAGRRGKRGAGDGEPGAEAEGGEPSDRPDASTSETRAGWSSILAGVCALAQGAGAALRAELLDPGEGQAQLLATATSGDVGWARALLPRCASAAERAALMRAVAAWPEDALAGVDLWGWISREVAEAGPDAPLELLSTCVECTPQHQLAALVAACVRTLHPASGLPPSRPSQLRSPALALSLLGLLGRDGRVWLPGTLPPAEAPGDPVPALQAAALSGLEAALAGDGAGAGAHHLPEIDAAVSDLAVLGPVLDDLLRLALETRVALPAATAACSAWAALPGTGPHWVPAVAEALASLAGLGTTAGGEQLPGDVRELGRRVRAALEAESEEALRSLCAVVGRSTQPDRVAREVAEAEQALGGQYSGRVQAGAQRLLALCGGSRAVRSPLGPSGRANEVALPRVAKGAAWAGGAGQELVL